MTYRITNQDIEASLGNYVRAANVAGFAIDAGTVRLTNPYGSVFYVCRYHEHTPMHDLPGFESRAGFATKREAVEALRVAAAVLRAVARNLEDPAR